MSTSVCGEDLIPFSVFASKSFGVFQLKDSHHSPSRFSNRRIPTFAIYFSMIHHNYDLVSYRSCDDGFSPGLPTYLIIITTHFQAWHPCISCSSILNTFFFFLHILGGSCKSFFSVKLWRASLFCHYKVDGWPGMLLFLCAPKCQTLRLNRDSVNLWKENAINIMHSKYRIEHLIILVVLMLYEWVSNWRSLSYLLI